MKPQLLSRSPNIPISARLVTWITQILWIYQEKADNETLDSKFLAGYPRTGPGGIRSGRGHGSSGSGSMHAYVELHGRQRIHQDCRDHQQQRPVRRASSRRCSPPEHCRAEWPKKQAGRARGQCPSARAHGRAVEHLPLATTDPDKSAFQPARPKKGNRK